MLSLAVALVGDGEGSTRTVRLTVSGAWDDDEAARRGALGRRLAAGQGRVLRRRPQLGPDRAGGRPDRGLDRRRAVSRRGRLRRRRGRARRRAGRARRGSPPRPRGRHGRARDRPASDVASRRRNLDHLLQRPEPRVRVRQLREHDVRGGDHDRAPPQDGPDPDRGAALHPPLPGRDHGRQVRRRRHDLAAARRAVRQGRRAAQAGRHAADHRARRRPRDHPPDGSARHGAGLRRRPARDRRGDPRGRRHGPGRQGQQGDRRPDQQPRRHRRGPVGTGRPPDPRPGQGAPRPRRQPARPGLRRLGQEHRHRRCSTCWPTR